MTVSLTGRSNSGCWALKLVVVLIAFALWSGNGSAGHDRGRRQKHLCDERLIEVYAISLRMVGLRSLDEFKLVAQKLCGLGSYTTAG